MAAPQFVPARPDATTTAYESPDFVPSAWRGGRPGELTGRQPTGHGLGSQGPDQGYALTLMERIGDRLHVAPGESRADAQRGILGIALRRASLYGRAPVIHDLQLAATIWGLLDPAPPADLVALRSKLFEGVSNVLHHYAEARVITDMVPESTLRLTPQQAASAYPGRWRELVGA